MQIDPLLEASRRVAMWQLCGSTVQCALCVPRAGQNGTQLRDPTCPMLAAQRLGVLLIGLTVMCVVNVWHAMLCGLQVGSS